jgi:hypothetical protein
MFDAAAETALQKYTRRGTSAKLGIALMNPGTIGHEHFAAQLIELNLLRHGALAAEPHYLLLRVYGKPPHQWRVYRKGVELASAETLELGFTSRIHAPPNH